MGDRLKLNWYMYVQILLKNHVPTPFNPLHTKDAYIRMGVVKKDIP